MVIVHSYVKLPEGNHGADLFTGQPTAVLIEALPTAATCSSGW
jgi:hypothetical protein